MRFDSRKRIWMGVLATAAFAQGIALAATAVSVNPAQDTPTQTLTVSGSAFGDSEAVDVYLDTTDTLLLVTSATGTFSGSITIPASTLPGTHYVTAIGRHSGDAAHAAVTVTTPWNQYGYGMARRAWNPFENVVGTSTVSSLGQVWIAANNGSGSTPVVSAFGNIYVSTIAGLQSMSASTGAVNWTAASSVSFYASPLVTGGAIYVGGGNGVMYSFSGTGATNWSTSLGGYIYSSAATANGIIYVGSGNNKVYALKASTGATLWSYATGSSIDSSPSVLNGVVYIGSEDGKVYALNAATGALEWSYTTGGAVESAPSVVNGIVYVGSDDGYVYAIEAAGGTSNPAGSLLWKFNAGGDVFQSLAVAYNTVFASSLSGSIYALSATTGAEIWSYAPDSYPRNPAVANGVVYFTSNAGGVLYALDAANGSVQWSANPGSTYIGSPVISNGVVYVSAFEGAITAYALLGSEATDAVRRLSRAPSPESLVPDRDLKVTRSAAD